MRLFYFYKKFTSFVSLLAYGKTETHILTEIAAGNKLAFEQLFFQYQPQLVAFLTGLTHDPELSRDMAQEIFLSIWSERKNWNR